MSDADHVLLAIGDHPARIQLWIVCAQLGQSLATPPQTRRVGGPNSFFTVNELEHFIVRHRLGICREFEHPDLTLHLMGIIAANASVDSVQLALRAAPGWDDSTMWEIEDFLADFMEDNRPIVDVELPEGVAL